MGQSKIRSAALKAGLAIAVLVVGGVLSRAMIAGRETPQRFTPPPSVVSVDATRLVPTEYAIELLSDGTVSPRTATTLIPEVAGRIEEVAEQFRAGAFFEAGDVLVRIDARNYSLAVTSAEAAVAQAQAALELELAEAEVVAGDWKALGREAPPLGLREPQIAAARADLASAQAQLERARVDLERTVLRAPYAGRVLSISADVGQFVNVGSTLAELYSVERAEVRLPLASRQLAYVDLPGSYRDDEGRAPSPRVELTGKLGDRSHRWSARIVRSEGAIDSASRRLFVIAEVIDPYARLANDSRPPLRVGQFVEARIEGRTLDNVFVLPRQALRGADELLTVTSESTLERRQVHVAWLTDDTVVIDEGLSAGEVVVTTPLAVVADGTLVRATVDGEAPPRRGRGSGGAGGGRPSPAVAGEAAASASR
ncbi:MAG: efflux RND transporter periplasmic adaptor subunit [Pseudomonadota bacterium]